MAGSGSLWAIDTCLAWEKHDPGELFEILISDERCPLFGPLHHFLVGAAMVTCAGRLLKIDALEDALNEMEKRASVVPGAVCAQWGMCGAASSCGMAFAILANNAPLRAEGWSEGQLMVSDILEKIAHAGAPRCCKRDSRIALRTAIPWFNSYFGISLKNSLGAELTCDVSEKNTVCIKELCPYYSGEQRHSRDPL